MASAALVFAGKSVAAPIIKEIVTKAFSYLGGFFSEKSMQELKDKLNRGMPKIQAVLDVVSPDQYKDKSQALDDWFWQLRDAVEEAEDAIDELEYFELEEKANDRKIDDWGSSFDKRKHKVAKSVKQVSVLDKVAKQFTHRDTIKRLNKALESLEKAAADVTHILDVTKFLNGPSSGDNGFMNNGRETGSMLTAPKFVGREVEKERITEWLTKTMSTEESEIVGHGGIPILSIVGHGGMGKTTLVQSILENKELKDFKTIWVTVSTNFDATSLISKILESVTRTKPSAKHLEPLQKELEKELLSVKYLLILDDVWEEEKSNELEKLFAPLKKGKGGSKILLTTRMTSVAELAANVMGVKIDCLILDGLKEDQSLELFNHHVFSGLNSQEYEQLKLIGEQIVRKLGGCPLVTKVASAALRGNMTSGCWNTFLHKSLEHFVGTKDDIMGVLRLSYYNLSTELQIVFRYCSLFPQDKEFGKKELVQLWIGSGLILPARSDSLTLVDIGERYLACLTRKSFFELKWRVNLGTGENEEYYIMHDLIHDLATSVSSGECARITDPDMFEKEKDTVRHLLIDGMGCFSVGDVKKIYRSKNLRTIIIDNDYYHGYGKNTVLAVERIVESSKSLRLFHSTLLHTSQFGNKLGKLKHLRYILLHEISPEVISGVVKLYHLMLLTSRMSLSRRTKEVRYLGNLDRLRYVDIDSDEFPVSRLTCLQELNHYRVQGSIHNKISAISDLRDLRELGLYCLENVNDQEEASSAKLNEKQYLNSLSLEWTECMDSEARAENSELVLDHLQPHDNIQKLEISGYTGSKFPCWIEKPSVKSLLSLRLEKCINLEHLPFVSELVLLKNLELVELPKLQQIGKSSHMFGTISLELLLPLSLQRLEVKKCSELRELPILPPGLNSLVIEKCPIVKELPFLPPSLVTLSVEHTGLTMLPMVGKIFSESKETTASRLEGINISYCQHLASLEGSLLEQKLCLGSLETLTIQYCKNLESASIPFEKISGLRELIVKGCPKLTIMRSAGDKLLPSSLTKITMGPCCYLNLPLQSLQGLTELSELHLNNCPGLVSLPSADVFKSLTSLRSLELWNCGDLSSLGGLRGSLEYLVISGCSKLVETPDTSAGEEGNLLQISSLRMDLPCLLLVEPLKSICRIKSLVIHDGSEMEALPERWLLQNRASLQSLVIWEAKSLESLPSSMRDLSCLEHLVLEKVEQLKSLPDLPPSLRRLHLSGCDSYLKKLKEYGNPERHKISHIRLMKLGGSYFIMGKECSKETYLRLMRSGNIELASSWAQEQKGYKGAMKRMLKGCSSNISKGLSHFK